VAKKKTLSVLQHWVTGLPMMQQTVLLTSIRGPDAVPKEHPAKEVRWFRRCILLSAMDHKVLLTPDEPGGGSFTGPAKRPLEVIACEYLAKLDDMPHHFHLHLVHAAQIVGYKHPDKNIAGWWRAFYFHLVSDLHLQPESEADMDKRLGDNLDDWVAASFRAVSMERNYQRQRRTPGQLLAYDATLKWPRFLEIEPEVLETFSQAVRVAIDKQPRKPAQWVPSRSQPKKHRSKV
jgi:hypothetical protein